MDINDIQTTKEAFEGIHQINQAMVRIWRDDIVFTWQWWLGVATSILPWLLWIWIRRRRRDASSRLSYAGFMVIIVASWFDFIGVALGLWSYGYSVLPTVPTFIPWDFSLIPVMMMIFLQVKPHMNPLWKALVISAITAFIGEPIFKWLGLYDPIKWKYWYSFVIYGCIYLAAHYISRRNAFSRL